MAPSPAPSEPQQATGPGERLRYRLLTGPDDRSFCERVSAALDEGYQLSGGPGMAHDGTRMVVAQAIVLPFAAAVEVLPV